MTNVRRVTNQLQQYSGHFLMADQDIVGPLKTGICNASLFDSSENSQADYQAQPFELLSALNKLYRKTVIEVCAKWAHPGTPSPSTTGRLLLGENQEGQRLPLRNQP
ncbi:hypothetical protein D3C77_632630 [compost metagenome]